MQQASAKSVMFELCKLYKSGEALANTDCQLCNETTVYPRLHSQIYEKSVHLLIIEKTTHK